eukprot:144860-Chlamydomonas_euryale.AAC.9
MAEQGDLQPAHRATDLHVHQNASNIYVCMLAVWCTECVAVRGLTHTSLSPGHAGGALGDEHAQARQHCPATVDQLILAETLDAEHL